MQARMGSVMRACSSADIGASITFMPSAAEPSAMVPRVGLTNSDDSGRPTVLGSEPFARANAALLSPAVPRAASRAGARGVVAALLAAADRIEERWPSRSIIPTCTSRSRTSFTGARSARCSWCGPTTIGTGRGIADGATLGGSRCSGRAIRSG